MRYFFVVIALIGLITGESAGCWIEVSDQELVNAAEIVLVGQVIDLRTIRAPGVDESTNLNSWVVDNRYTVASLETLVSVNVFESLKGDIASGQIIEFKILGGVDSELGKGLYVSTEPQFRKGEGVLLLMKRIEGRGLVLLSGALGVVPLPGTTKNEITAIGNRQKEYYKALIEGRNPPLSPHRASKFQGGFTTPIIDSISVESSPLSANTGQTMVIWGQNFFHNSSPPEGFSLFGGPPVARELTSANGVIFMGDTYVFLELVGNNTSAQIGSGDIKIVKYETSPPYDYVESDPFDGLVWDFHLLNFFPYGTFKLQNNAINCKYDTTTVPSGVTGTQFTDAADDARDAWNSVCSVSLGYNSNSTNVIKFEERPDHPYTVGAITSMSFFESTGELIGFQMFLNTIFDFSTDVSADTYDVQSVITHEFGHVMGLHHLAGHADYDKVMHKMSIIQSDEHRTLKSGDIAGAQFLYP